MGFTLNQLEQERQIRKLQKKEDKDTKDYEQLSNLPKINNVELKGDKTTGDLDINATNVMMSDGETSVEDALSDVKTGTLANVKYIKTGRIVTASIATQALSNGSGLGFPGSLQNQIILLRDESVGGCVQVVINKNMEIASGAGNVNFVDGHNYSGSFSYISAT